MHIVRIWVFVVRHGLFFSAMLANFDCILLVFGVVSLCTDCSCCFSLLCSSFVFVCAARTACRQITAFTAWLVQVGHRQAGERHGYTNAFPSVTAAPGPLGLPNLRVSCEGHRSQVNLRAGVVRWKTMACRYVPILVTMTTAFPRPWFTKLVFLKAGKVLTRAFAKSA